MQRKKRGKHQTLGAKKWGPCDRKKKAVYKKRIKQKKPNCADQISL
jgi:hypothetical protein